MQVAQTILGQLGGQRFVVMTGATSLTDYGHGLAFRLPRGMARDGVNYVVVTLAPADLYKVSFFKLTRGGLNMTPVREVEGVYADRLRATFTEQTGLDTSL